MELSSSERDPIKAADWLEARVVCGNGQAHVNDIVGKMRSDGMISDEEDQQDLAPDLDPDPDPDNHLLSAFRLATSAASEIQRRVQLCGDAYPFTYDQGRLIWTRPDRWADPYLICLLAADRDVYQSGDNTAQVFEHLTTLALGTFLGGKAVRFGFPRDTMPQSIREALPELAQKTATELRHNPPPIRPEDKDIGLDVVSWSAFPDQHNNRLQLYVQCTTEKIWENKKGDLNLDEWNKIIDWGVRPVPALAIPYVTKEDGEWLRKMAGSLVFDRLRIVSSLSGQCLENGSVSWADWVQGKVRQAAEL